MNEQQAIIKEYLNCFIRIATHAVGNTTYALEAVEYGDWYDIDGKIGLLCQLLSEANVKLQMARQQSIKLKVIEEIEREKLSGAMKNKEAKKVPAKKEAEK